MYSTTGIKGYQVRGIYHSEYSVGREQKARLQKAWTGTKRTGLHKHSTASNTTSQHKHKNETQHTAKHSKPQSRNMFYDSRRSIGAAKNKQNTAFFSLKTCISKKQQGNIRHHRTWSPSSSAVGQWTCASTCLQRQ